MRLPPIPIWCAQREGILIGASSKPIELGSSGFSLGRLRTLVACLLVRQHQINVVDAKGAGQMEERHNGWVASAPFEIADVLLCKARDFSETLLGETFLPA